MNNTPPQNDDPPAAPPLAGPLGGHAARGGAIAIAGQVARIFLQLVVAAILARLLAPGDFGLFAMANTLIAFIGLFSDLGLSGVTLQRAEIDDALVSTLFYLNIAMGVAVMVVALAAAPLLGLFYRDPRVVLMAASMALTFPVAAAGTQHSTLLQRQMRWGSLQIIWLVPQAVAGAVAVLLAWEASVGYWVLVVQAWISVVLGTALAWTLSSWRPSGWPRLKGAGGALQFGLPLTGASLMNYLHRQMDNVLIGWRWGASDLGQYTRGYMLLTAPLGLFAAPIASAVIPALSRLQDDPERWAAAYVRALGVLNLATAALAAALIASAEPLVQLIYGPQWSPAGRIFLFLAISIFSATPVNACSWAYFSLGKSQRLMQWTLITTPFYVLAFIAGLPFGAKGVALSYSVMMTVSVVPCFAFQVRWLPLRWMPLWWAWLPATAAGVGAVVMTRSIASAFSPSDPFIETVRAGGLAIVIYAAVVALLVIFGWIDHPRKVFDTLRG